MAEDQRSLTPTILATASLTGVALHLLFFKHVEVDKRPASTAGSFVLAYFLIANGLPRISSEYEGFIWKHTIASLAWFSLVISLWTSILLYRAFFHPLKNFPGPFGARLTKLWSLNKVLETKIRWYRTLNELHKQYGDFVRTGPRELVIFDAAAITPVLGFASPTGKGPFYDSMETSVNTTRDKIFHRQRRKVWDHAFKISLSDFAPRVEELTTQLLSRISKNLHKPILVNEICIHYSYDVMSALAFGEPMGYTEGNSNETAKSVLDNIQKGVDAIGLLLHVPWLMGMLTTFSWAIGPMREWNQYSEKLVIKRKNMKIPKPDLLSHLLNNTEDTPSGRALLNSECRLIVGAGSDTTATALTFLLVNLALYPQWLQRLREEVDPIFAMDGFNCGRTLPVLDAIINESMRLYPSVFFGSQRETPPEGLKIGDTFIPGGTIVSIPAYQLSRDERNFIRAKDYLPERWTSNPELIINKAAYMPFLTGPGNCAGRNLAMMELRSVVARIAHEFDIAFPPGQKFDAEDYFSRIKDHFVSGAPPQELVFTRRVNR
ncbi:cytochrome P450 [Aspergillus karnatakaensis]|uniref:cytochrome P450 n=1 Tax=Aspergillus karnatakaensis TaxID=1810916 RepID=UPI003CCD3E39